MKCKGDITISLSEEKNSIIYSQMIIIFVFLRNNMHISEKYKYMKGA